MLVLAFAFKAIKDANTHSPRCLRVFREESCAQTYIIIVWENGRKTNAFCKKVGRTGALLGGTCVT